MHPKTRTMAHKALEMPQAIKIEALYSKEDILRAYLDHAPYAGNIIGIQAASYRYFGKRPYSLTCAEATLLAVLPNTPGLISPTLHRQALVA